jgi:hypothetical protein
MQHGSQLGIEVHQLRARKAREGIARTTGSNSTVD